MKKKRKFPFKAILIILLCIGAIGIGCLFGINAIVMNSVSDRILTSEDAAKLEDVDCILVLGCQVKEDGTPSHMLEDRIKRGVALYDAGAAPKLLMSGDHGRNGYNEVGTMKQYAMEAGINSENIFMDHAGFSTYESVYRARDIFQADKILIVTQEYHLYRALYIAEKLGVEAYGVSADYRTYAGQTGRDLREILARCKDFMTGIFQPEPTFLGEAIPISGSGDLTNDYDLA